MEHLKRHGERDSKALAPEHLNTLMQYFGLTDVTALIEYVDEKAAKE